MDINQGGFTAYTPTVPARPDEPAVPAEDADTDVLAAYDTAIAAWRDAIRQIDHLETALAAGVLFARNEAGDDWYDLAKTLSGRTVSVRDGVVDSVVDDATMLFPAGATVVTTDQPVEPGWTWDGTALSAPPVPTLDEAKQKAWDTVAAFANKTRSTTAGNPSPLKAAGWPNKAERARRVLGNVGTAETIAADRSVIQVEATDRGKGETVEQLAQIQLGKEARLSAAMYKIDGVESKAWDSIDALTDIAAIEPTVAAIKSQAETEIAGFLAQYGAA